MNKATTEVFGFVDSNFTGDLDKRRSITGYMFTFMWRYNELESLFIVSCGPVNYKGKINCSY